MLLSVLMPTRNRVDMALDSLKSLIHNALDIDNIEFLLRIDEDDEESMTRQWEFRDLHNNVRVFIGPRGDGYLDLHKYVNFLASNAEGEFLFLWNDDAIMQTDCWDTYVHEHKGECIIMHPVGNDTCYDMTDTPIKDWSLKGTSFPIVSRRIVEVLGYFSLHPHNDTYLNTVMRLADTIVNPTRNHGCNPLFLDGPEVLNPYLQYYMPEIQILHDRFDYTGANEDVTFEEGRAGCVWDADEEGPNNWEAFEKLIPHMWDDAFKIVKHIVSNGGKQFKDNI